MKVKSLWWDAETVGRSATVKVTLRRCPNCGEIKVLSEPCGFDHLAALMEFGEDTVGRAMGSEARATAPRTDAHPRSAPGAVRDDESASVAQSNLRVIQHEIETPMRGHDDDGACCRAARDGESK